ncbi:alkyl/aryl-sulfatase [Halomonas binhaiensis]|uniref:Linear primary-alkylsulfatase n=1 Tax=Halomonas binhaiensis TaxID=2562282 RepID=A0A5C1NH15_9GAMM|nr:alkyl sulfatase dimerization domain-containing protein [Halomonas binhaiensis]QEM81758.1 MBL fold metallo-hydrolase [Halomonas binhaiensis]
MTRLPFAALPFTASLLAAAIALGSSSLCWAEHNEAITPKPATAATQAANAAVLKELDFADRSDFENAQRGLIKATPDLVVKDADGRVVWDVSVYQEFLQGDAPDTVNPSLWRLAQLNNTPGLYEVTDGIYQVRGFDLATMTVVRGDTGWIVIDPLTTAEPSKAAMELVNSELGERPVTAIIYTHSHADHFAGVRGVVSREQVAAGDVRVIGPEHMTEHVASESVLLGNVMSRRSQYMFGFGLPRNAQQQVDAGLGKGVSNGTFTFIEPTEEIAETGQTLTVDGVDIEFLMAPGTEADAEMVFYFPEQRALLAAEILNASLHNILTPRGAKIRDALVWSRALDEVLQHFGDRTDVVLTSHYWPRWGQEEVRDYIEKQRDMLKYLHDQTLRLANLGYKRDEIAEAIEIPDSLANEWFNRGYYGTIEHNVKGIYQRYLGFWSGNPATLDPLPEQTAGERYVDAMGGAEAVMKMGQTAFDEGDYRWGAMLMNHLVMAQPDNQSARELQADIFEQLGYQAESAPWRNIYLTGARELRNGFDPASVVTTASPDILAVLPIEQIFDLLAVRLNGPKADGLELDIDWHFTGDEPQEFRMSLDNSVLRYRNGIDEGAEEPDLSLTLSRDVLNRVLLQQTSLGAEIEAGNVTTEGDVQILGQLFSLLDNFNPTFPIATSAVPAEENDG